MEALVILVAVLLVAGTYGLYRLAIVLKDAA
jgi:NADH:ubiquinone oxidoreductase subunit 4 (subunit M)